MSSALPDNVLLRDLDGDDWQPQPGVDDCEDGYCPDCWGYGLRVLLHGGEHYCSDCTPLILSERYPDALKEAAHWKSLHAELLTCHVGMSRQWQKAKGKLAAIHAAAVEPGGEG